MVVSPADPTEEYGDPTTTGNSPTDQTDESENPTGTILSGAVGWTKENLGEIASAASVIGLAIALMRD
jgi:hypothetical protein